MIAWTPDEGPAPSSPSLPRVFLKTQNWERDHAFAPGLHGAGRPAGAVYILIS